MIAQPLRNLLIFTAGLFLGATAHAAGEPTADPIAAAIGSSERPAEDRNRMHGGSQLLSSPSSA